MEARTLGSQGLRVSPLGLGCMGMSQSVRSLWGGGTAGRAAGEPGPGRVGLETHGEREARALTIVEIHEWLAILDRDEFARRKDLPQLTRFLIGTGCRLGEAVGVHWEDVDLERQVLHVRRTVLRVRGHGMVAKRPKSRAGERTLRLPLWLVAMLRERRGSAPDRSPVFPDVLGGYRDRNNIEKDFRKVREERRSTGWSRTPIAGLSRPCSTPAG